MPHHPLTDILVKPAGPDCNLACGYCFYREREALFPGSSMRMSDEVLEAMIRQLMDQPVEQVSIGWQGGEPTLMGIPFFQRAVGLMERHGGGRLAANGIQTNGTLIDDAWARFFKRYRFLVGLSIDGPARIHDRYRRTRGGQDSHRRVVESAEILLDAGVAVNALTVVNDYSGGFPEEIYSFNKKLGLPFMQFIPCVETDPRDPGRLAPFTVTPETYGSFLCTIFDLWHADFTGGMPSTSVRFFESLFYRYVGRQPPDCTLGAECGTYVVVEHTGDVYPCDFFVEQSRRLGNILETPLPRLAASRQQRDFGRRKEELPDECGACRWQGLCRGGCVKDRLVDAKGRRRNHLCDSYRVFFEHADGAFRRMADEWKKRQDGGVTQPLLRR